MLFVYATEHIRVKVYLRKGPRQRFESACGDVPSDAFLAAAIQSATRYGRRGDERNSVEAFVPGSRHLERKSSTDEMRVSQYYYNALQRGLAVRLGY